MAGPHVPSPVRAVIAAILVLAAACGCGRAPATPPASPRIIAFSPAVGLIVRDLGHAGLIVGRHGSDTFLSPSIPVCGDQVAGPDYEAILRARPTLFLSQWGSRPRPERLTELASRLGFDIADYRLLTLDDIPLAVRDIDARLRPPGSPPTAGCGALLARMEAAWRRREGLDRAGRILLLHAASPPGAIGPGSFHHEILLRIGGAPAITDGSPYIELDAEDILRLAPEGVILISPRAAGVPAAPIDAREALGGVARLATPAARTGRFAVIDHPGALTPASPMIDFAEELAAILERWAGGG